MNIIAWNINGLKSLLKTNNLDDLLKKENPDIFCMGETKMSCSSLLDCNNEIVKRYPEYKYRFWSQCSVKAGYAGTAILSKIEPKKVMYGLNDKENIDNEGRVITLIFDKFILVHVYTPNSGEGLKRLDWRINIWDKTFLKYINSLKKLKTKIIICGDLNVAHDEIDLKNPKTNLHTPGFTEEERKSFNNFLLKTKMIDSYRLLNPTKIEYSFWSFRRNARPKNIGWRIDYFLLTNNLKNKIIFSNILTEYYGSDHAPIILKINI
jgi:exodeoxyribonuclease-3